MSSTEYQTPVYWKGDAQLKSSIHVMSGSSSAKLLHPAWVSQTCRNDEDSGCCRGLKDAPDGSPRSNTAVSSLSSYFQLWVLTPIPFAIPEQLFVSCSSYLYRQMKLGKSLISFKLHLMKSARRGHIGEKAPGNPLALSAGLIHHNHSISPSSGPSCRKVPALSVFMNPFSGSSHIHH